METLSRFWPDLEYGSFDHLVCYRGAAPPRKPELSIRRSERELLAAVGVSVEKIFVIDEQPVVFDEITVSSPPFWEKAIADRRFLDVHDRIANRFTGKRGQKLPSHESFRDPIERAFSHWAMAKSRDESQPDFSQAVRDGWATRWPRTGVEVRSARRWPGSLVSRGYYHAQLEHVLGLFSRQRLGAAPPSAEDVSALAALYAADLAAFAETSGLDVAAWPTARVLAGSIDPGDLAVALADRAKLVPPESQASPDPALANS